MSTSRGTYKRKTDELDGINPLACSSMDTWNTGSQLKKPSSSWETGSVNYGSWQTDPRLATTAATAAGATPSAEQMSAYNAYLQMQMMQMMNPAMAMMNPAMMMNAQNLAAMGVMQTANVDPKNQKPVTKAPLTYGEYKRMQRLKSEPGSYSKEDFINNRSVSMDSYSRTRRDSGSLNDEIKQEKAVDNSRYYPVAAPVVDIREHELQKQLEMQRIQLERQQQQLLLQQQQLLQLQEKQKLQLLQKETRVDDNEWDDSIPSHPVREPEPKLVDRSRKVVPTRSAEWDEPEPRKDDRDRRSIRDRDDISPRNSSKRFKKDSRSRSKERDGYSRDRDEYSRDRDEREDYYGKKRRDDRRDEWNDRDRRNSGRNFNRNDRNDRNERRFSRFDSRDDKRFNRDDDRRDFGRNKNMGNDRPSWKRESPPRKSRFSREGDSPVKVKQEDCWDDEPYQNNYNKRAKNDDFWDDSPPKSRNDAVDDFWGQSRDKSKFGRRDDRRHDRGRDMDKQRYRGNERDFTRNSSLPNENWDDEEDAPKPWTESDKEIVGQLDKDAWNDQPSERAPRTKENPVVKKLLEENWDDEEIDGPSKWIEPIIAKASRSEIQEEDWDKDYFGPENEWVERPDDIPPLTQEVLDVQPDVPKPIIDHSWEEEERKLAEKRRKLDEENWDDDDTPVPEEPWTTIVNPGVKLIEGTKAVVINGDMYLAPANPVLPPPVPLPVPVPAPVIPEVNKEDFSWEEEYYPPPSDWLNSITTTAKQIDPNLEDSTECVEMEIVENEDDDETETPEDNVLPPGITVEEFEAIKTERLKLKTTPEFFVKTSEENQTENEIQEPTSETTPIENQIQEIVQEEAEMNTIEENVSTNAEVEKINETTEILPSETEMDVDNESTTVSDDKTEEPVKIQEEPVKEIHEEPVKEIQEETEKQILQKPENKIQEEPEKSEELRTDNSIVDSSKQESDSSDKNVEDENNDDDSDDDILNWNVKDFGSPTKLIKAAEKICNVNENVIELDDSDSDVEHIPEKQLPVKNIKKEFEEFKAENSLKETRLKTDTKIPEIQANVKMEPEEHIIDVKIDDTEKGVVKVKETTSVHAIKTEIEEDVTCEKRLSLSPLKISTDKDRELIKSEIEIEEFNRNEIKAESENEIEGDDIEIKEEIIMEDVHFAEEIELAHTEEIVEIPLGTKKKPSKATKAPAKKAPAKKRRRRKAWTTRKKKTPATKKVQEEEDDDEESEEEEQE